jgi:homoserine dehydrogenase
MPKGSIGLGLLGYGNIGREVFDYYRGGRDGVRIVRIARRRPNADAPAPVRRLIARRAEDVIADPDVDIVADLTGDAKNGARYALDAIAQGKHVVTANKSALSTRWSEIMARASERGVSVGFEATVGGGMPVVRTMLRHLSGDEIESFAGILNGTCNFILGRMSEFILRYLDDEAIQKRSLPLEEALREAQRLGFAEPDPTLDINGFDTKYKVAILADLAFRCAVDPEAIYCEGIRQPDQQILPSDLYFLHHPRYLAGKYALKLVGVAQRQGGRPVLRVQPSLIERAGELAELGGVDGSFNGIIIRGARLGTQFLKGLGAGPKPTAVSVASDIGEIAASILRSGGTAAGPPVPVVRGDASLGDFNKRPTRGFIRSFSPDVKGVFAKKLEILAKHRVNVQSMVNVKEFVYGADRSMPDYIEIDSTPDGAVRAALRDFRRLRTIRDPMYFRVLEL